MEKGGKEEILTELEEKYHFRKRNGAKISIIWLIYTPALHIKNEWGWVNLIYQILIGDLLNELAK